MTDVFQLVSRYFWLILLAFSAVNYHRARRQLLASLGADPAALAEGQKYQKRFAFAAAVPWVVMGAGQLSGLAPTVWHYFRPQDGNPFVLVWLGCVFTLACVYAWWVLFVGGAAKVKAFHLLAAMGHRRLKTPSELSIKALAVLGVAMPPAWVCLVVSQNVPLPK